MSVEWLVWTVGPAFGALVGSFAAALVLLWWQRRHAGDESLGLSEEDRESVELAFATHASAVASQVSSFADELAGDDPLLRERLRRLELQMGRGRR